MEVPADILLQGAIDTHFAELIADDRCGQALAKGWEGLGVVHIILVILMCS